MIRNKINNIRVIIKIVMVLVFVGIGTTGIFAQVNFTQRTSSKAPAPYTGVTNYNLQGDFTMIGNTNITLVNYSNTGSNSADMQFVDIDGQGATRNSSSAQLNIPGGECTEIVYAGLYWTGRAQTSSLINPGYTFSTSRRFGHNGQIEGNAIVTISRQGTNNDYYPRYTITVGSSIVQIDFTNNNNSNRVQYRTGTTGSFTSIPVSYSNSSNVGTATFNTNLSLNVGGQQIIINGLQRDSRTTMTEAQYRTAGYVVQTTDFDKRKIKLKKDNLNYEEITAHTVNNNPQILFPNNNYDYIYAAYSDVTDYVRANGAGNYFVGDIALVEGNGGSVGYIGGWGMVIIYKNTSMKWRDITVFDGYGYMSQAVGSKELPVSGFRAAQNGNVNVKFGMMAAEGDVSISNDYFDIRDTSNAWRRIDKSNGSTSTPGTSTPNFFNSSILTGGNTRNPNLQNNTGIDIVMFDLVNTGNSIIGNSQTSSTFRFGSNQDVYSIFNIVFAVDAYVPQVIGENTPGINNPGTGSTVDPDQDLEFDLNIYNKGTEAVNNLQIDIPIPFNLHYDGASVVQGTHPTIKIPNNTTVEWIKPAWAPVGATPQDYPGGTLRWNVGTLPLDTTMAILQGTLKYKFKVTSNCALLSTVGSCGLKINVNGTISGTGATSGVPVSAKLVRDYAAGSCSGAIYDDFESTIAVSQAFIQSCSPPPVEDGMLQFKAFCSLAGNAFPRAQIADRYPLGTKFFTVAPPNYDSNANLVTGNFPVAANGTKTTYYAMVPGMEANCYIRLQTSVELVTTQPTVQNVSVCQGSPVVLQNALSPTGVTNGYQLYYFDSAGATVPLSSDPNPTAVATHNYWVAEGTSVSGTVCIGPKVPFTVTINAQPVVAQNVGNISICENNDAQITVNVTGGTTYNWEYATAAAPTVWNTLNNTTYSGQITVNNAVLNISHATTVLNGIKVRLKVANSNNCEDRSNQVSIEIKNCGAITNPMLPNKAKQ
ncbi:hypothetical protein SAMN05421741_1063 [Paenimyroides ummariense]|uniref:Uncharacterized protein n=1 Tax=Paenimyroides ummariense TaxID=913024 RepID=A0A1I4ZBP9_9FLAO|nr:hypothetical protein [Paenimyroides ummariense]SFN47443.1 hypothetical protein SAMN05421741_1063 [Paenimyroides ummariense]